MTQVKGTMMGKYQTHVGIVAASLGIFLILGFASVFAASGGSKYTLSVGKHRVQLLPVKRWALSSYTVDFCGLDASSTSSWQVTTVGPIEIKRRLDN